MVLLIPDETIARRWNGALQARLVRAPLEEFLRARKLDPAPAGACRDTDNLARAAIYIVEAGVSLYFEERTREQQDLQHDLVGQAICAISHALAVLIETEASWRIAALVGTAKVLSARIGLNAAAHAAAAAARDYDAKLRNSSTGSDLREIGNQASIAIRKNEQTLVAVAARSTAQLLASGTCREVGSHLSSRPRADLRSPRFTQQRVSEGL